MANPYNMAPKIDTDELLIGLYGDEGREMVKRQREERIEKARHEFDGTEYEGMTWKEVQLREQIKMYEKDKQDRQKTVDNFPGTYVDPMIDYEDQEIAFAKMVLGWIEYGRKLCEEKGVDYWQSRFAAK